MSNGPKLARGRHILIKGLLVSILIVVLFALINFSARSSNIDGKEIVKRGGPDGFLSSWNDATPRNPCFEKDGQLFCGPSVILMGIQYAGLELLKQAIDLHPDVDCYSTGFFTNFSDIGEVKLSDFKDYTRNFENSSRKIQYGADKLCICDSGRLLARTYDLELNSGVFSPPEFTMASLVDLYDFVDIRIIVILRDPTVRFIQEYCSLNMEIPFENFVDDAIAGFLDCERNTTRNNASCVYDASLSGLLQAGLYDFLIENDLSHHLNEDSVRLITYGNLVNPATRNATIQTVLNYLDKDIPSPYDPYWADLNDLFVPKPGNCNGQTITDEARQKLQDFYRTRATIFLDMA